MEPEEVVVLKARQAASSACTRLGISLTYLVHQDREDIIQSAAMGFWKGWLARPGNVGYAYVSARNEAVMFLVRVLWGKNPFSLFSLDEEGDEGNNSRVDCLVAVDEGSSACVILTQAQECKLFEIFLASRQKRGGRGERASMRDAHIVLAICRGESKAGIASDLGISLAVLKVYRKRARRVLKAYLAVHPALELVVCRACGCPAQTRHHIVPRRADGAGDDDNLAWLCNDCHAEVENFYMRQERPGLAGADWRELFSIWLVQRQAA